MNRASLSSCPTAENTTVLVANIAFTEKTAIELRQVPSGSSRAVTPSEANHASRTPERLGSDDEEDSLSSPTSRSSRLSRSLRNGEIIPRNSHQNSSNNNDGGAICHEEMSAADCYEKRIAFIQKQHEKMLAALHREVEQLKRKNKELQFQLVMRGLLPAVLTGNGNEGADEGATILQLTAEDAFKLEDRVEASMIQLQADLHEAKSRNIYLNDLVEEQKRKLENYELKESAAQVVKATTSFPLSPPFMGFMGNSDSMGNSSIIRSYSSTLISTPVPRSREDASDKIKFQDEDIDRLEKENIKQRQELMEMRLYIERNVKLKFKGCNHPNQTRLLNRPRRQNASPDFILGPTRVNPLAFSRSSSMTQLPTIRNTNGCHNSKLSSFRGSTSSFHEGLPPVLGTPSHGIKGRGAGRRAAGGSESSSKAIKPPPLNLASLRRHNSNVNSGETTTTTAFGSTIPVSETTTNQRKPSTAPNLNSTTKNSSHNLSIKKLKLKQPVMMSKPTLFSNVTRKIDSRNNNLDIMRLDTPRNRTNDNHARK